MSALDTFSKCTSRVDPRPRPLPPNFSFSASKTHHSPLKHHPQSLRLVRDQVSLKISTDIQTLVNSVYHGRYFDSKFSCEVRGHSPVTGKARNTKGGSFVCFCRLFYLPCSSTPAAHVIFFLSPYCPRSHTYHRSVLWYTKSRHSPRAGFVSSRKCVPDINLYPPLKHHPQSGRFVRDQRAREKN